MPAAFEKKKGGACLSILGKKVQKIGFFLTTKEWESNWSEKSLHSSPNKYKNYKFVWFLLDIWMNAIEKVWILEKRKLEAETGNFFN